MRRYFQCLVIMAVCATVLLSCGKETVDITDTTVGHSRITNFPLLTVKGAQYVAVAMGGTFTEPGVSATEGGNTIPVTTTGTINTATPGVYSLTYTAVNKDGFSTTGSRTVVVYSTAADAALNDFSGNYARTSNGVVSTWTKIAPGVYVVLNPGGAAGSSLTAVVLNASGTNIKIPSQRTSDGNITSSSQETYTKTGTPQYSWVIVNPGYGPALRTFVKQ